MKKIAFIGTHGVRKTTAVYMLAAELKLLGKNVEIVSEVARRSPMSINKKTNVNSQLWIFMTQIKYELEAATTADYIVSDRSVLDNYAYYLNMISSQGLVDPYPSLAKLCADHISTYDLLVLIEPDVKITSDGVRSTDLKFQNDIHKIILELIDTYEEEIVQFKTVKASEVTEKYRDLVDWI